MFHNFESQQYPLAKRRKVGRGRACDFCRAQRVRCDSFTPCSQCEENHVLCSRPQSPERHFPREDRFSQQAGPGIPRFAPASDRLRVDGAQAVTTPQERLVSGHDDGKRPWTRKNPPPRQAGSSLSRIAPASDSAEDDDSLQFPEGLLTGNDPPSRETRADLSRKRGRTHLESSDSAEDDGVQALITPQETSVSGHDNGKRAQQDDPASMNSRLESMTGFISRLNAFCSGMSQLSQTSPTDDPLLTYTSPFGPHLLEGAHPTECDLSPVQVDRLLEIFWARLHPLIPILSPEDMKSHSPLRDAVTAYAMQYAFYSGLHSRLLGLQWKQFSKDNRCSRVIGMSYLQRCLASATQFSTFAEPSLPILQCYCIMTLYLLDAGQHQAAYNMIGLAVRMARSLNFDSDAPAGVSPEEMDLTSRIWWTLVHLDFRCSRHLGKPFSAQLPTIRSTPPCRLSNSPPGSDYFPYHTQSIQLTYLALGVIESIARDKTPNRTHDAESQAEALTRNLWRLDKWRIALQKHDWFQHLQLGVPEMPQPPEFLPTENADTNKITYMNRPPLQHQLSTLLELQYRDIIISLHRVFIQFPTQPLVPKSSPQAEAHAATALKHGLATIETVHRCMSQSDLFFGSCELYQYQWNAVLTLMGFMLAYPFCHRCPIARGYIDMALETFEFAGPKNDVAVRAACLTRYLRAKVDKLTMILNIDHRKAAETSAQLGDVRSGDAPTAQGGDPNESATIDRGMGLMSDVGQEGDGNTLWSWVDLIDPDAWPSYCDEVNEVFMRGSDADLFQNAFYS
ncbi:Zn(II)2Cys6 transcription factor [Aspergillus affinis]|uniref:Zn(II)2Cys6 transcription factor n=1 Tax=Aspergillus affinis TaxID=1070780 RepID=UPI0022FE57F1|nr:uncharacterized protein KD926_000078 [Aspergillus affinis]KAI9037737.1 hypothetical protein KD926_000078 [Aspergillus affinis]